MRHNISCLAAVMVVMAAALSTIGVPADSAAEAAPNPPRRGCLKDGTPCCFAPVPSGCKPCPAGTRHPSALFGCKGELWSAKDRLVYDWASAGYMQGNAPMPKPPVTADLKQDFGAAGDGETDDTAALKAALDAMQRGVLYIPPGHYVISDVIDSRKPIVIRGAGRDKTTLLFTRSLSDIKGNSWRGGRSDFAHSDGLLNIRGWDPMANPKKDLKVSEIVQDAEAGDMSLRLGCCADSLQPGTLVRLLIADPGDGSVISELQEGLTPVTPALIGMKHPVRFVARVTRIDGDTVWLDRPIPIKVRTSWSPELHRFWAMLDGDVGIEELRIEFPHTPYEAHLKDLGWNAIHLNQVVNGWIRNVEIVNADCGIYSWGSVFTTIEGLTLSTTAPRGEHDGHRGVWLERGSDNLVKGFNINLRMVHDLTVADTEFGTVFVDGRGIDLNFDHHKRCPYANLYTAIDVGRGSRVFESSGDGKHGRHTCRWETFYGLGVRGTRRPVLPNPEAWGPGFTYIGAPPADGPAAPAEFDWHVESIEGLQPPNLYTAMRYSRAARLGVGAAAPKTPASGPSSPPQAPPPPPPPPPAAPRPKPAPPPPAPAGEPDTISLAYRNTCPSAVVAAIYYKGIDGEWVADGWFTLAPGERRVVAKTLDGNYFTYAYQEGDEECSQSCWTSDDLTLDFQGRALGWMKMRTKAKPGQTSVQRFSCN